MSPLLRTLIVLSCLVPVVSADAAAPQTQPAKVDRERYNVLTERNMFLRDRRRPVYTPTSRPAYVSRPVEETLILTGVVFEEGEYRAFFEDTQRSSVLTLRVGESVGRGVITQIQLDAIQYLSGDSQMWIDVGHTLTGSLPPAPPTRLYTNTTATATATGSTTRPATAGTDTTTATPAVTTPLPNPDDPNLSLEERMKLRRAQQLGGGQ
jgi:hypothetical protein